MGKVLCSTGALIGRPNGRDFHLLSSCGDHLRCDGLEFMMYDTWYSQMDELAPFLRALPFEIPVLHCEKRIGEAFSQGEGPQWEEAFRRFEINCQLAVYLGAKKMVMHLWDGLTSDQYMENNLRAYPRLSALALKYGIDLLVENVVCVQADPLTRWRELQRENPDVHFVLDTKMSEFHGQTEALLSSENRDLWTENRIRHLHINDYGGGVRDWAALRTLHPGQGHVDFERLFAFLDSIHYTGDYTVEATSFLPDGVIHWDDLNRTFAFIRGFL